MLLYDTVWVTDAEDMTTEVSPNFIPSARLIVDLSAEHAPLKFHRSY